MASQPKYVVLYLDPAGERGNEGVFVDGGGEKGLAKALACIRKLAVDGLAPESFEVEMWEGSKFQGTYNHEGKLVEKANGEAVSP